jgi:hypothetical protein
MKITSFDEYYFVVYSATLISRHHLFHSNGIFSCDHRLNWSELTYFIHTPMQQSFVRNILNF